MGKLVTIFGGSGFVGRYVARRLAKEGWRIRVAVRRPNEALFVKPYGHVGQVTPVFCNIRDDASVRAAMEGADAVVNCVGIMNPRGGSTFKGVQADGAGRVARIAAELGVSNLVHVSALGADAHSSSDYARSKAEGEAAIQAAFPAAVILRPSVLFGTEDKFFNRFAGMSGPILPLVGAETRFQPVYVDDLAKAVVAGVNGAAPGIYELGGPEVATLRELMQQMLTVIMRRKWVLGLPSVLAAIPARGLDLVQGLTGGLISNTLLTRDQLRLLAKDNVVSEGARGFAALGIQPVAFESVIPEYLWRFRPSGQYAAIKESAKNLKA
ncbi:complex I NDUFA9 subunit family protein [Falsirhodobacter xinxiangensis]|uniref:complex I NDUFA9 subunit family protein n=1 Tax=Falsirhodobacter xinxiangensis TaxID=2530049 RepID=UPI0010AB1983|nr:complex I NDUFA9 subunit family protein [Rhodobacter xinxiangensis]